MGKQELSLNHTPERVVLKPYEHKTRYYETDQMGIIHQTNYMKWMEEARMDMMDQLGLGYKQMETMEIINPMLSASIDYRGVVRFDDTIVVETRLTKYDGVLMEMEYTMYDKETQDVRAKATSSHCFLNRTGARISLKRVYPELDTRFFEFKNEGV